MKGLPDYTVPEARAGLGGYFAFYNHERPHRALGIRRRRCNARSTHQVYTKVCTLSSLIGGHTKPATSLHGMVLEDTFYTCGSREKRVRAT